MNATEAREGHAGSDGHRHQSRLAEIILGGQDGLVNVLGVVLGISGATSELRVVLAGGVAAAFAESISMAAVAFTSARAQSALYESEREREHRHVRRFPELEREEVREIYRQKGLSGDLLERVVETLTANPDVWVAVMMAEELKLSPVRSPARAAFVVGISALVGSLLPLVPFFFLGIKWAMLSALVVSAIVLFAVGAYQAMTMVGKWWRTGLELALIGLVSALCGYGVGSLFGASPG